MSDDKKPEPTGAPDVSIEIDGEKYDKDRALKTIKAQRESESALKKRIAELEKADKDREDAKKDDLTKANDRVTELEASLAAAERRNTVLEIAIEKKLTVKQANRLTGSTREELEADADDFIADLGGPSDDKKPLPTKQPREALRGGGDPTANEDPEPTADEAADTILKNL